MKITVIKFSISVYRTERITSTKNVLDDSTWSHGRVLLTRPAATTELRNVASKSKIQLLTVPDLF
jgi:hypothetical protein